MADSEPVCARCKVTSSLMWEKNKEGEVLCLECHSNARQEPVSGEANTHSDHSSGVASHGNSRESPSADPPPSSTATSGPATTTTRRTRLRNAKGRYGKAPAAASAAKNSPSTAAPSSPATTAVSSGHQSVNPAPRQSSTEPSSSTNRGRVGGTATPGRRSLVKGVKPKRAPSFVANIVTSDTVLHKGTRYEVGDIVSILDESGRVYYALLRGFLEDQYAEKYAALTWLIPTTPNPKNFDPSLFVLGPEEDSPKDMECLDFVTHSPQSASFVSSLSRDSDLASLWTCRKRRRVVFTS